MTSKIRAVMLTLIIASTICMTTNMTPVLTETTEDYPYLDSLHLLDAVGTYFEIPSREYLSITLTSSKTVHVILESIPQMISVVIESVDSATSTTLTLRDFEPNTMYYRYQDGYFVESFITDENGGYTYTQDISQRYHVVIRENQSTLYIDSDYTFTSDIYEPIVVIADNIVIDGNGYTVQGPGWCGFYLYERSNVTIKNVTVKGFSLGIELYFSDGNKVHDSVMSSNTWVGIHLLYSDGNTLCDNTVSSNARGGIELRYSNNNEVSRNTVTGNGDHGIVLFASSNNILEHNDAYSNGSVGIALSAFLETVPASNNTLLENHISNNNGGILLSYTNGTNILKGNNMTGTLNFGVAGGNNGLLDFIHDIDTSNTVDGKPIYYWVNQENRQIPADAGYVGVVNSTNIIVRDLTITNNIHGLMFAYTTNSSIENVTFSNNALSIYFKIRASNNTVKGNRILNTLACIYDYRGIALGKDSNDNTLTENMISNCSTGIGLGYDDPWMGYAESIGNLIFHNNFIGNNLQAQDITPEKNSWHHPTLLEGNYWSDYPGVDDGSGTGKHAIPGDGIGDTNIPWPGPDHDYYPLMSPWAVVGTVDIDPDTLNLKSNGEWITAYVELPEGYNVEDVNVSTVMINNTIPIDPDAPTEIADYDFDGVPDLMVKFDRASIIEWLGAIDYSEETGKSCLITVSITGNVLDVLFEGLDTIKMLRK